MQTKKCQKCSKEKVIFEFRRNEQYEDNHSPWCITCCKKYPKEWAALRAEERKEYFKKWYIENKDRIRGVKNARDKKKWDENPEFREKKKLQRRMYYEEHKK